MEGLLPGDPSMGAPGAGSGEPGEHRHPVWSPATATQAAELAAFNHHVRTAWGAYVTKDSLEAIINHAVPHATVRAWSFADELTSVRVADRTYKKDFLYPTRDAL